MKLEETMPATPNLRRKDKGEVMEVMKRASRRDGIRTTTCGVVERMSREVAEQRQNFWESADSANHGRQTASLTQLGPYEDDE